MNRHVKTILREAPRFLFMFLCAVAMALFFDWQPETAAVYFLLLIHMTSPRAHPT